MKRLLTLLGVAGLAAIITYLAVTRQEALRLAEQLRARLAEAEAQLSQREAELAARRGGSLTTRSGTATTFRDHGEPVPAQPPPATTGGDTLPSPASATRGTSTLGSGGLVIPLWRYTTAGGTGITNLIRIEGTSTIQDWQVQSSLIGGFAQFGLGFPEDYYSLPGRKITPVYLTAFVPVRSLASVDTEGKPFSDKLDALMREKLRADRYPNLTFVLETLSEAEPTNSVPGSFRYAGAGYLAIAGVTNRVMLPVLVTRGPDSLLGFTGTVAIRMTDYGIVPPVPVLGSRVIKTGDEVTVTFTWWTRAARPGGKETAGLR